MMNRGPEQAEGTDMADVATAWICSSDLGIEELTLWREAGRYRWREMDGRDTGLVAATIQEAWEKITLVWKPWHVRDTLECPYCG